MKKCITVNVLSVEKYDGDWPPEDAVKSMAWFNEKIESIPPEFRNTARIELDSVSGYEGSHYARITISYTRMETDAEEAMRELEASKIAEKQRQRELKQLAELQNKYGKLNT